MLHQLNPITFQEFGTVLPERPDSTDTAHRQDLRQLKLS